MVNIKNVYPDKLLLGMQVKPARTWPTQSLPNMDHMGMEPQSKKLIWIQKFSVVTKHWYVTIKLWLSKYEPNLWKFSNNGRLNDTKGWKLIHLKCCKRFQQVTQITTFQKIIYPNYHRRNYQPRNQRQWVCTWYISLGSKIPEKDLRL